MLGCYDFCGHYDWTFRWLEEEGGKQFLLQYWDEAIREDSQEHAATLIEDLGFQGMVEYWGETLAEEAPKGGFNTKKTKNTFWIEMTDCPSRGFLVRNEIDFSGDYCDHCIGWIGPLMKKAGYTIDHDHNHQGQCWWEFKKAEQSNQDFPDNQEKRQELTQAWKAQGYPLHQFRNANHPEEKA